MVVSKDIQVSLCCHIKQWDVSQMPSNSKYSNGLNTVYNCNTGDNFYINSILTSNSTSNLINHVSVLRIFGNLSGTTAIIVSGIVVSWVFLLCWSVVRFSVFIQLFAFSLRIGGILLKFFVCIRFTRVIVFLRRPSLECLAFTRPRIISGSTGQTRIWMTMWSLK